ncbi:MAG: penicillin-binding protein activator LpoB [Lentisphaerae bacterium GWF2_44_16]|nr:MAG: penicillin-binding protein activator LpoB [Lentisphaerae bacterium GWF2_44_16]
MELTIMIKKRVFLLTLISGGLVAALVSCSSPTVKYGDPTSAKPISTDFGSNDLQQTANSMVNSMLTFPPVVELTRNRRPIIEVSKVNNKTMQHIDTQSLTDSIRTKLLRSGKFRFTDRSSDKQTIEEIRAQQESGLNDQNTVTQFGQQYSAEFILVSNLSEIKQRNEDVIDVYYKFTMSLKNLKTGILEWSDEQEIRKIKER